MKKLIFVILFVLTLSGCKTTTIFDPDYDYVLFNGQDTVDINTEWIDSGAEMFFDGVRVYPEVVGTVDTSIVGFYIIAYHHTYEEKEYIIERFVAVVDDKEPVITLNANVDTILLGDDWDDAGVTIVDNSLEYIIPTVNNTVDEDEVGTYVVTYTAEDPSGNIATIDRYVNVIFLDQTSPHISLNSGVDTIEEGDNWIDAGATVTDNSGEQITAEVSETVDENTVGEYIVTYTAIDSSNNLASIKRIVTVIPKPPEPLTIEEALATKVGADVEVTGVVYDISAYGLCIHNNGFYIFVYTGFINDEISLGDEITLVGERGEYNGSPQLQNTTYTIDSHNNGLVDEVHSTVSALQNELIPYFTIATVKGKLTFESYSYDIYFLTDAAGGKVKIHYLSNVDELEQYLGEIITIDVIMYQKSVVLYKKTSEDVIVETGYTDQEQVEMSSDNIVLGDITKVQYNIYLPTWNDYSSATISWSSSNSSIVSSTGIVTRPFGDDVDITLNAVITVGTATVIREFTVTVIGN